MIRPFDPREVAAAAIARGDLIPSSSRLTTKQVLHRLKYQKSQEKKKRASRYYIPPFLSDKNGGAI